VAVLVAIETSLNHALWVGAAGYALLALIAFMLLQQAKAAQPEAALEATAVAEGA
jgi:hypothetical protein